MQEGDPGQLDVIAVTDTDVVVALETNLTTARRASLRVTPPFSGRMRARLHVENRKSADPAAQAPEGEQSADGSAEYLRDPDPVYGIGGQPPDNPSEVRTGADAGSGAIQIRPTSLVSKDAPSLPRPADTEDALRAHPTNPYSLDRHRDRHATAMKGWRLAVADAIVSSTRIRTPAGPVTVDVRTLAGDQF